MVLLANVLISTARSSLNRSGGTLPPTPYLDAQEAHGEPASMLTQTEYRALPAAALESNFVFRVDPWVDIVADDVLTSITLRDGITPWAQSTLNPNETLRVVYAADGPPELLPYKDIYVRRYTGGGLAYS